MNIKQRILRVEASIPKPSVAPILLHEPTSGGDDDTFVAFNADVSAALSAGRTTIVIRNGADRLRRPGVIYVDDAFNGSLALMANSPSTDGRSNRLTQLIAEISASGSSLPVVQGVSDG